MDVGSKEPLQVIKFDHPEPPTKHGWELIEGSEQYLLPCQRDPDYGRILQIKAEQDFCMDYHVGVLQQACKAIGFIVRSESNFAFYAEIRVRGQHRVIPDSKLLYCHVIEGSYPEQHSKYSNEYEVHVPVNQLENGWVSMKIDLLQKAREAAALKDEEWEFDRLLMLRLKGSRVEIDCARIELYKENPWERLFGLQDASDYTDRGLRQPPAIPTFPAIRQLANLIRARQVGDQPYTLLLGSSLSLTPEVRQAVCDSDDWEAFWTTIQGLSAAERRALLTSPLDGLNLTAGYRCLAQLVQAGYFDLVLTLNVDDALDESLRILSARKYQILTHGQVPGTEIAVALGRTHPRVKVVKLRGDINAYRLPLTPEGQFEFPKTLEEAVERLLSQDTILVGDIPYDTDIQRCIREGEGALWVVVPEELRPGSFLYNAKRARPKGEIITGTEAEFVSFFAALARELEIDLSSVQPSAEQVEQPDSLAHILSICMENDGRPHNEGPKQWWVRLVIESEKLISKCEGWIYDVRRLEGLNDRQGKYLPRFQSSILSWADGIFAPISIETHKQAYLDLAWRAVHDPPIPSEQLRIASARDQGKRDTKSPDWGMRQDFIPLEPGYYLLVVRIMSEGYAPVERTYRLHWPGSGQEDEIRLAEVAEAAVQESTVITAPNPFGDTGRITDPDRFFGREELLRQIFEELGKGVNISLVGESQVGKSSLLSMVCALGSERMGLSPETFAYLSLEWVDSEDEFYEALCDALNIETCRGYRLTRALRDKRHVLCLDEIEKMAWDGFTVRLRSQLRGLADGPATPLKLVIASRSPLGDLFPDSTELTSPFAGICHPLDVVPFSSDVARAFLAHRLRGTGVTFTESEISALLAETGGHPAKLQRAAADLYHRKYYLPESSELSGR